VFHGIGGMRRVQILKRRDVEQEVFYFQPGISGRD
jgi:hypothetical protein